MTHKLKRVVPNESWQLVLEVDQDEYRLFDASIARIEMGWPELADPDRLKSLTFTESGVAWPGIGELTSAYLYEHSKPLTQEQLERQMLRVSYKNQAPTDSHPTHHVYGVYLYPFSTRLFDVGESIGGGHAEMGGSRRFDLPELLASPDWKCNFELSGCAWAIPLVETYPGNPATLSDVLVRDMCRRATPPPTP